MVCKDCVGDVPGGFCWYTHHVAIVCIDGQTIWQVRHNLVGQATSSVVRWYAWNH